MQLNINCETCEFYYDNDCIIDSENSEKTNQNSILCDDWSASFEYYSEITENAPWYIKEPYKYHKINYEEFIENLKQDAKGVGIRINLYDAIEKIYDLNIWELASVLGVSI